MTYLQTWFLPPPRIFWPRLSPLTAFRHHSTWKTIKKATILSILPRDKLRLSSPPIIRKRKFHFNFQHSFSRPPRCSPYSTPKLKRPNPLGSSLHSIRTALLGPPYPLSQIPIFSFAPALRHRKKLVNFSLADIKGQEAQLRSNGIGKDRLAKQQQHTQVPHRNGAEKHCSPRGQ